MREDRIETLMLTALGVICRRRLVWVWYHCLQDDNSVKVLTLQRPIGSLRAATPAHFQDSDWFWGIGECGVQPARLDRLVSDDLMPGSGVQDAAECSGDDDGRGQVVTG